MNPQDLLNQLRDIHLPSDPSWWPPAPGWWLVAALLIAVILWLGNIIVKWYQQGAAARQFVSAINALPLKDPARSSQTLKEMSRLTRQYAISSYGRSRVAGLCGHPWLVFLDHVSETNLFTNGHGTALAYGHYQREFSGDLSQLGKSLIQWARKSSRVRAKPDQV